VSDNQDGMAPKRVQYRRGVQLPEDVTYVGRPSPWGNPFRMTVRGPGRPQVFSPSDLSGPVGVGSLVVQSTALGFVAWLLIVAVISSSVALLNLLPILPLDGGGIIAAAAEMVAGRRLTKLVTAYSVIGYVVIAGLALYATGGDVLRLVGR